MPNVYERIRDDLTLTVEAQGDGMQLSLLYLLLDKLAQMEAAHPTNDTYVNPIQELLTVRLGKYAETFAVKDFIAPLLVPRLPRFGA
ncbi:MAG TPA: hypothetical protein VFE46_16565 [Pirellulales bacterium]|jgi:hypothetical protein|nr:hypothetical protein [Pirellulales bacterium]